ncbi:MAG: RNA-guided pseudouridylation complex pseudouridine synthase subunit Cbf5, partial [Haloferacaceae archaeon]
RFGVVNLDKPPGPSAHQVAAWVRDLADDAVRDLAGTSDGEGDAAGVSGAAHAGTLDPKVTGCLPVLTGEATRLAQAFLEGRKEYVAVLELHRPAPADLGEVIESFEAPLYQKPPRKSAVTRRLRVRRVHDLEILEAHDRRVLLRIGCESGTYVRKLCHDLGLALGTGAHMGDLRRTATTPFDDGDLVTLHDLVDAIEWAKEGHPGELRSVVRPAERALSHLPTVAIAESAAREVAHGAPVYAPGVISVEGNVAADDREEPRLVACETPGGSAVCLGRLVGDPDASEGTVVDLERVLV